MIFTDQLSGLAKDLAWPNIYATNCTFLFIPWTYATARLGPQELSNIIYGMSEAKVEFSGEFWMPTLHFCWLYSDLFWLFLIHENKTIKDVLSALECHETILKSISHSWTFLKCWWEKLEDLVLKIDELAMRHRRHVGIAEISNIIRGISSN